MKNIIKFALIFSIFTSLLIAKTYTIKFSHVVSPNTPKGKAAEYFARRLEKLSEGKIKVKVFPNSSLYNDKAVMMALKLDNVQMAAPSFSKFTSLVPQLQLFDLPFLFKDTKHLHRVLDGEVGTKLKNLVNKKGFVALNYWDNGFKNFSSSLRPLILPKDAKGQKFRIMSSKVLEAQFKVLGANPQVLPFSEVYSALQQGVVDGAENPLSNFYTKKFYEVQSSLTLSSHGYLGYLVVISEKFWKKLPKELKKKVIQAMNEASKKNRELAKELESKYLEGLKVYAKNTKKLKIYKLSAKEKAKWRKIMFTIYPQFYDVIGKNLIDKALLSK